MKMIKVKIIWREPNTRIYSNYELENLVDLRTDIKKQTTYVLRKVRYQVEKTPKILEFFKTTYYAYVYTEFEDYIELNELPVGKKRYKNVVKKTNSNVILLNTLERIEEMIDVSLEKRQEPMMVSLIAPKMTKSRIVIIRIIFTDKKMKRHECSVEFDKIKWTFKIQKVESINPQLIIDVVKKSFFRTTYPTRVYRRKHKVIQNENTIE
jgi:hypothetical protein